MMKPRTEEDDDDEDHGGLVKKIMETKKEYEQTRKTEIVSWKGGHCRLCDCYCFCRETTDIVVMVYWTLG